MSAGLTQLIRSLALMTLIKNLGRHKDRVDLPPDAVSTFVQTARLVMGGVRGGTRSG
jgi:hypothetical protein